MAQFFKLAVTNIEKTIRDAVVVTLSPKNNAEQFHNFIQGQYLTFRHVIEGEELRRNYSICSGKDDEFLQIGIKRVEGGAFSTWANSKLKVGDTLEALLPRGAFHTSIDQNAQKKYLGFAGGSGITPVLSIIKTLMTREPKSSFTLIYANRNVNSIMFREELEDLKNLHIGRLNLIHILETENQEAEIFSGRIDNKKCRQLFKYLVDISDVDVSFICGPEPMMLAIAKSLRSHGLKDSQIKFELFTSAQPGRLKIKKKFSKLTKAKSESNATVTLDGATHKINIKNGQSVLEAALANSLDVPFACKAGVCSTCRAKIIQGEVEMVTNHSLEDYEVARGFILTCQSYPLTNKIVVDYDH